MWGYRSRSRPLSLFLLWTLVIFVLWMNSFPVRISGALSQVCNANKYSRGSAFEMNLKRLLDYLTRRSGRDRIAMGERGKEVYGLLQCRGDASRRDCQMCSHNAVVEIRKTCPAATGALVWFDLCFLRYQNANFTSDLNSEGIMGSICNTNTAGAGAPNPGVIKPLMEMLAAKASLPANRGFATGEGVDSSTNDTIYGLVQCLDLPFVNCSRCVLDAICRTPENCLTNSGGQLLVSTCHIRFGKDKFYTSTSTSTSTSTIISSSSYSKENASRQRPFKLIITMAVIGGVVLALLFCFIKFAALTTTGEVALFKTMRHDQEAQRDDTEEALSQQEQIIFKIKTLKMATRNFDDENKVGEGGFGPVYKGTLLDGTQIAVKKLSVKSKQGKNEFLNEVEVVAKIQHRNLVKLLGCCASRLEKLLVYEYMPNNSLDKILFDPKRRQMLDWKKRYNIIVGVARGLVYLHEDSQPRIIHRDIKAGNILLDEKLNPKISDFGMARLVIGDTTGQGNTRIAGTYGYMAPEYALRGELSVKVDIFSFGVLLLEILSGRKNTEIKLPPKMQILLRWAWGLYRRGRVADLIDPAVSGQEQEQEQEQEQIQMQRCIHIGLLCAQADATVRPPMSSVFLMLSSDSIALPVPTIPGFVHVARSLQNSPIISPPSPHPCSTNDISITQMEGR